ncbi:MAG: hypothetical protein HY657_01005 [Acidobacteria bacterium]|nr:hypothetical protein [Acidobacteriota bacterium]
MNNRTLIDLAVIAAVVLVMFPLIAIAAMITAHFGFGLFGSMSGIFGQMGWMHAIGLLWALLTVGIVAVLVALLVQNIRT